MSLRILVCLIIIDFGDPSAILLWWRVWRRSKRQVNPVLSEGTRIKKWTLTGMVLAYGTAIAIDHFGDQNGLRIIDLEGANQAI